jgi:ribonucleotide reductase alpha subunit
MTANNTNNTENSTSSTNSNTSADLFADLLHQLPTSVTKRNGKPAPFEASRIRKAIYGAFWEYTADNQKSHGVTPIKKGENLGEELENEINKTTRLVLEGVIRKNLTTVEEIESLVEDTIWSRGHKEVAKLYIGYRAKRKEQREAAQTKYRITITKSTGERVPFQIEPLEEAIHAACKDIPDVSEKALLAEAENSLYDGVKTSEITEAMIQAARSFIEREPNYSYVASRLLLQKIADESLSELGFSYTGREVPVPYGGFFTAGIAQGVKEKLYNPALASFDLKKLEAAIRPERDLNLQYLGLKTLADRYLVRSRDSRVRIELPQSFFMRVCMGLALNEVNKEEKAIEFYNILSQQLGMSSTPTLFNSGLVHSQLSSCYLLTVGDNIEDIFKNFSDNARLSKWAGGIGNDWTAVRGHGSYIGGTNGESQGGVPWWKITNGTAVAVNQGSKRKGAICNYLETWHIDIEDFLELRKETGDDRRRCHDMNTANWIPDLFMKRMIAGEDWWLFSPDKTPDLHDLYGKAFEDRYAEYEKIAASHPLYDLNEELGLVKKSKQGHPLHPCKRVSAVALWKKMLASLFETGHPWITFKDSGNVRSPQDHVGVVHSSNLCCVAGDQRVATDKGILTVKELFESKAENTYCGSNGHVKGSEMYLPRPNTELVEIKTKEGYTHKVTPDHKVSTERGQIMAKDLVAGDKIHIQQHEGPWGSEDLTDLAFCAGFLSADGGINEKTAYLDIWEGKTLQLASEIERHVENAIESQAMYVNYDEYESGTASVAARRKPTFGQITKPSVAKQRLMSSALGKALRYKEYTEDKLRIPEFVWRGTKETVAAYLRGILIADGTFQAGEVTTMSISSISKTWIEELQILIANFGVKSSINLLREAGRNILPDGRGGNKEFPVKACYRLLITSIQGCKILEGVTGAAKLRGKTEFLQNLAKDGYAQKMWATFTELTPAGTGDAFCPTVDAEDHLWTANGILTRNTEIFLNTSTSKVDWETGTITEVGEVAVCNLASINIPKHIRDGKVDKDLLKTTVRTLMRMLDNVVDLNYYPIPEAKAANMKHRPVGLGIMGVHTALQMLGIPYDSQDAIDFSDVTQELISFYAIEASCELAQEKGAYESFRGSKWDRGIFPVDTLALLAAERGEDYVVVDTTSQFPEEWTALKAKVKEFGLRNSNTMAIAPTACVTADTLVLSSEGLLPIVELSTNKGEKWEEINIHVAQETGVQKATKFYHNGVKPITKITTESGAILKSTSNERIRVIDSQGDYVWKWMEDVQTGDIVVRRLGGYQSLLKNKPLVSLEQPSKHHHNETKGAWMPPSLTPEWAEIIGHYMANGYTKSRHGVNKGVVIVVPNTSKDVGEKIIKVSKEHGIPVSQEQREGCTSILLSSSRLADLFDANGIQKEKGNHGEGAASASIPTCVLRSNPQVATSFLRGLFEGDGTVGVNPTGTSVVELATVSEKLASQTKQLLEALGIRAKHSVSGPGSKGTRDAHRVRLSNIESCRQFALLIGFQSFRKQKVLCGALVASTTRSSSETVGENLKHNNLIEDAIETAKSAKISQKQAGNLWSAKTNGAINIPTFRRLMKRFPKLKDSKLGKLLSMGDLLFEAVISKEQLAAEATYDLSVPATETYIANGIVCHNTIANICGVSEGIMPEKAPLSRKENLSGSFPLANPILINKLKELGLWQGSVLEKMKMSEGSIQSIEEIPAEIRALFKTCFEIHPSYLIECASRRQKWIDQGQSLNLFAGQPSGQYLSSMYKLAWIKGLKSTYYLRSVSASQKEKTSIEVQKHGNTTGIKPANTTASLPEQPAAKKTFSAEEKMVCSIQSMREGIPCEACE